MASPFADHLARVHERMRTAAHRAGRDPADITLVAVSKTHPAEAVRALAACGQIDFGENRIEEAVPKIAAVNLPLLHWHMIGHIQSRKAKDVLAAGLALVHSVDSLKLAERLSRLAIEAGRIQPILLECNVSGEATKEGFDFSEPHRWAEQLANMESLMALPGVRVRGLMTMAPMVPEAEHTRPTFARLRELRDYLAAYIVAPPETWRELSMGMTDDFEVAIAEGATFIRVGRALFGARE